MNIESIIQLWGCINLFPIAGLTVSEIYALH